jgi:hypothetical protein
VLVMVWLLVVAVAVDGLVAADTEEEGAEPSRWPFTFDCEGSEKQLPIDAALLMGGWMDGCVAEGMNWWAMASNHVIT